MPSNIVPIARHADTRTIQVAAELIRGSDYTDAADDVADLLAAIGTAATNADGDAAWLLSPVFVVARRIAERRCGR